MASTVSNRNPAQTALHLGHQNHALASESTSTNKNPRRTLLLLGLLASAVLVALVISSGISPTALLQALTTSTPQEQGQEQQGLGASSSPAADAAPRPSEESSTPSSGGDGEVRMQEGANAGDSAPRPTGGANQSAPEQVDSKVAPAPSPGVSDDVQGPLFSAVNFGDVAFKAQTRQDRWLLENVFTKNDVIKTNRFFVEFGARDGEAHSNSHYFEKRLGWRGILAEASPFEQGRIAAVRSQAAVINGGFCAEEGPKSFTDINQAVTGWGGFPETYDKARMEQLAARADLKQLTIDVQCYRLDNVLRRFGVKCIDYLSVDTEGNELDALSGFPFESIPARVIGVEVLLGAGREGREGKVIKFMEPKGYKLLKRYSVAGDTVDLFFEPSDASKHDLAHCIDDADFSLAREACVKDKMCLA